MRASFEKNKKGILLMVCASLCVCVGQLCWKLSGQYGLLVMLLGFGLYGLGALITLTAYRYGSLSVLQPGLSLNYVLTVLLAALVVRHIYFLFFLRRSCHRGGSIGGVSSCLSRPVFLGLFLRNSQSLKSVCLCLFFLPGGGSRIARGLPGGGSSFARRCTIYRSFTGCAVGEKLQIEHLKKVSHGMPPYLIGRKVASTIRKSYNKRRGMWVPPSNKKSHGISPVASMLYQVLYAFTFFAL